MSKTVKMKHATACSFSHEGNEIVADKKGAFDMPPEMVAVALEHGFEHFGKAKAEDDKQPEGQQPEGSEGAEAAK